MGIPYTPLEGVYILLATSSLLALVIIISYFKKLAIGKEFTYAIIKGGGQLVLIALFLTFLFESDYWFFLIWILILTMIIIGGHTSAKRATHMPQAFQVTTPSILAGASVALTVLALSRAMPLQPQYIIPLAGMAFGNSMSICSLSLDRLAREIKLNKTAVETMLSLGIPAKQTIEEYNRLSIRAALIPTIDRLKTLGVIFIPGAMAELLIAGTDPLVAAEYQIIVYLMIVSGGIVSAMVATALSRKKIFNEHEQLAEWTQK
jgi:putative ABC transport system permease protein